MDTPPAEPRDVRDLRGRVVRRRYARGSKSERDALMLATAEGDFLLRRRGGPAFGDTGLDHLLDAAVACDGTIVGNVLLVDRARRVD
jgi:hypothetical protein